MNDYVITDLILTDDGDLVLTADDVGSDGNLIQDLSYISLEEALQQIVKSRIRTDAPDWFIHPTMGGNLSDLIGEPNTRENAALGVEALTRVLTYDNFLTLEQIEVRAVPINKQDIIFYINITVESGDITIPIPFSYTEGLVS